MNEDTDVKNGADVAAAEDSSSQEDNTSPTDAVVDPTDGLDDLDDDDPFKEITDMEEEVPADDADPDTTEEPKTDDSQADPTPARGREARMEKLADEIAELRKQVGIEPNADIRAAVKERTLLQDMASNSIRSQQLQLERDLLDMTDPNTSERYTPSEASAIARATAINAESAQLANTNRELTIESNRGTIQREILTTMDKFPIFQEKIDGQPNPLYNEASKLAGEYLLDAYLTEPVLSDGKQVVDQQGQPVTRVVGIKRSPIEILTSVATSLEQAQKNAQARATKSATTQALNADVPVNGRNTSSREDPDFKAFDDTFNDED